jgi:hydrogenase expression/formation protein HypC
MCLAIPRWVVEITDDENQLAKVDVSGVRRAVNIGLVNDEPDKIEVEDWVLIHVGFAMSKIDEKEAQFTLQSLEEIGEAYRQELQDLTVSRID